MTAKETMLEVYRNQGRADALALRKETAAGNITDTELIDREAAVPAFDPTKDYSSWAVGSPVADEGQVWKLLQPYDAANYPGRPSGLRALWGLAHTCNPKKAKPYVEPLGTSGMYMKDECCTEGGTIYRSTIDDNVWAPSVYPQGWEVVSL